MYVQLFLKARLTVVVSLFGSVRMQGKLVVLPVLPEHVTKFIHCISGELQNIFTHFIFMLFITEYFCIFIYIVKSDLQRIHTQSNISVEFNDNINLPAYYEKLRPNEKLNKLCKYLFLMNFFHKSVCCFVFFVFLFFLTKKLYILIFCILFC